MTIHGSKSELKRLRYLENCVECVSTLIEIVTFDLIIGISTSFSVLETRNLDLSRDTRISSIGVPETFKYAFEVELGKKSRLLMSASNPAVERSFF